MSELSVENVRISGRVLNDIVYCNVCSAPPEYCSYFPTLAECKKSLQSTHPELYELLYSEQPAEESNETEAKPKKVKKEPKKLVTIMTLERTKRKRITQIRGLELFGIELKKASKLFASRFAASASVSKIPAGGEEILVQGDCADEIFEFIIEKFNLTEKDLEFVEAPKKKKG